MAKYSKQQKWDIGLSAGGGALSGVASGAAIGTMLGTAVPGIGNIIGAGVGALAGGIGGLVAAKKENAYNAEFDTLEKERQEKFRETLSRDSFNTYGFSPRGNNLGGYYKMGGKLQSIVNSGKFKNLNSSGKLVVGASHSQGGVKDLDGNEFEGGEVIDGKNVLSDRIPTSKGTSVAEEGLKVSKTIGKAEKDMQKSIKQRNKQSYNASKRLWDLSKEQLELLFEYQENVKQNINANNEANKFAYGGGIGASISMDNSVYGTPRNITGIPRWSYDFMKKSTIGFPTGIGNTNPNLYDPMNPSQYPKLDIDYTPGLPSYNKGTTKQMFPSVAQNIVGDNSTSDPLNLPSNIPTPTFEDMLANIKKSTRDRRFGSTTTPKEVDTPISVTDDKMFNITGAGITKGLETLAPIAGDLIQQSVANRRLRRMDIPKPSYLTPISLDKTVDISGELSALNENKSTLGRSIDKNVADSQTALAMKGRVGTQTALEKGKLYTGKTNAERQIANKELELNLGVQESNNRLFDDYRLSKFNKNIQTEVTNPSAKSANALDKMGAVIDNERQRRSDITTALLHNAAVSDKMLDDNLVGILAQDNLKSASDYLQASVTNQTLFDNMYKKYKNHPTLGRVLQGIARTNNFNIPQ